MNDTGSETEARVAARICHDLAGPLGAAVSAVELLELSGASGGQEMSLLRDCVSAASARLSMLRLAFGPISGREVSAHTLTQALSALAQGGRTKVVWAQPTALTGEDARLCALLCLCAETLLARGGEIKLDTGADRVRVDLPATSLRDEARLLCALTGTPGPDTVPAEIHFGLAHDMANSVGRPVHVVREAERLVLTA